MPSEYSPMLIHGSVPISAGALPFEVESVALSPDPPVIGTPAVFTVNGQSGKQPVSLSHFLSNYF